GLSECVKRLVADSLRLELGAKGVPLVSVRQILHEAGGIVIGYFSEMVMDALHDQLLDGAEASLERCRRCLAQRATSAVEQIEQERRLRPGWDHVVAST